jgi:hypothetical protein
MHMDSCHKNILVHSHLNAFRTERGKDAKKQLKYSKIIMHFARKEMRNQFAKAVAVSICIKINRYDYKSTRHEN